MGLNLVGKGHIASFKHLLPQLLDCAAGDFQWDTISAKIASFGWEAEDLDNEFQWGNFRPDDELQVTVDMKGEGGWGKFVFVIVYNWDFADYNDNREAYESHGRADFDAAYQQAVAEAAEVLGQPQGSGVWETEWQLDADYKYSWWQRGDTRIVVQQAELDIQFGPDVSLWFYKCSPEDPMPLTPPWSEPMVPDTIRTPTSGFWERMFHTIGGDG